MKATVNLQLDKRRPRVDGSYTVVLVVYYKGKKKRYFLPLAAIEKDWAAIAELDQRLREPQLKALRDDAEQTKVRAKSIVELLGSEFTFDAFEDQFLSPGTIKKRNTYDAYQAFDRYIDELQKQDRIGTAVAYTTAKNAFRRFADELTFRQITPEFLYAFEKFMLDNKKTKTTVGIYMRSLRAIVNTARYQKLLSDDAYPFGSKRHRKYEIPIGSNPKRALDKKQVAQIMTYKCDSSDFERARDMWLFTYHAAGMNLADVLRLKYKDIEDGYLSFVRTKTVNTQRREQRAEIYLAAPARKIVEQWGNPDRSAESYVFDVLKEEMSERQKFKEVHLYTRSINQYLERIAAHFGWKQLSLMTARHSYASISLNEGVPIESISESMAHSSIATTANYLKGFDRESKKQFAERLIINLVQDNFRG